MTNGMKSSEFWVTLVLAALTSVFPDLPEEAVYTVIAYIVSRGVAKHGNGVK